MHQRDSWRSCPCIHGAPSKPDGARPHALSPAYAPPGPQGSFLFQLFRLDPFGSCPGHHVLLLFSCTQSAQSRTTERQSQSLLKQTKQRAMKEIQRLLQVSSAQAASRCRPGDWGLAPAVLDVRERGPFVTTLRNSFTSSHVAQPVNQKSRLRPKVLQVEACESRLGARYPKYKTRQWLSICGGALPGKLVARFWISSF